MKVAFLDKCRGCGVKAWATIKVERADGETALHA
jgi:hypothetical protein